MTLLLLLISWAGLLAVGLKLIDVRDHWHWRQMSLEARLRHQRTRAEVYQRALGRLRADWQAGKLLIGEDYRALFERLTNEGQSGA